MQESGLIEIIPLVGTLTIQGQHPAFLHPESPQGAELGGGCSDGWFDGCSILCLLKWQAILLIHTTRCWVTPYLCSMNFNFF